MNKTEELTRKVKEYALKEVGFDLVGFASATDPQFDRAPKGHHPTEWLPGAKTVIAGGIKVLREILVTTPSPLYAKHYEQMNTWLLEAGYRLSRGLQDMDFEALYFPETDPYGYYNSKHDEGEPRMSPSFCHIHSAVAAGLGKRGHVGVVLTPEYGPRQRWTTILTTGELIPDSRMEEELCLEFLKPGSCNKCVEVCRDERKGALKAWPKEGGVIQHRCESTFSGLAARGLLCGQCISVCPVCKENSV